MDGSYRVPAYVYQTPPAPAHWTHPIPLPCTLCLPINTHTHTHTLILTSVFEDMEKLKPLYTVGQTLKLKLKH